MSAQKQAITLKINDLLANDSGAIFTTIGVYPDLSKKCNGVLRKHLMNHAKYNLDFRPGRAFFVNGECLYSGSLNQSTIDELQDRFSKENLTHSEATIPYR